MNQDSSRAYTARKIVRRVAAMFRKSSEFKTSGSYWEDRYRRGGNSGAGSYNRLALFKARILNDFVEQEHVSSVIEFGSGDGAQLALATYPAFIGVDVSRVAIETTRERFADKRDFKFFHSSELRDGIRAELSLSLDVIYHLVEDEVFDSYMAQLFDAADKYVIIYSSNEDKTWPNPHVRHRQFTRWIDARRPEFKLMREIPSEYPYSEDDPENTSFADFYIFVRTV